MFVLEVLVVAALLAAVALLAAGRFDGLADEPVDDPDVGVPPDRPLRSSDVPQLRFRLAIRGYRMSDVDAAMAAVEESLRQAETQPAPAPIEPEPLPPPPLPPLSPEPSVPETAEQPPTDVEDRPLSELEAQENGSAEQAQENGSAEQAQANGSAEQAQTNGSAEQPQANGSAEQPQANGTPQPASWQPPPPLSGP